MRIRVCVVGLGYVGLPLILNLSKKINCVGFDVDRSRIENLKLKKDTNKEFKPINFEKKKIIFTSNIDQIRNCNFYIVCVPTPITSRKKQT